MTDLDEQIQELLSELIEDEEKEDLIKQLRSEKSEKEIMEDFIEAEE
jgi:mannitol/fructose-specific phosphotransferase system IIA component (Ntr-type)